MKKAMVTLLCVPVLLLGGAARANFVDDFEDGMINPAYWVYSGDITESDGYLNLDREDPDDWIQTVDSFSGNWIIELDIRLNYIVWNDMFHGISIRNDVGAWGAGISFGFSQYGWLYLGLHGADGNSISYYYGNSNLTGQWRTWRFMKDGSLLSITVDGEAQGWIPSNIVMPEDVKVDMPGFYEDGDGGPHSGVTSSDVDIISISVTTATQANSWSEVKALYR